MTKFPVHKFVLQSFGLTALKTAIYSARIAADGGLKNRNNDVYTEQSFIEIQNVAESYLGTPVFDNIVLLPDEINLRIDTVLLSISQTKNIVKTAIQGLNGTVKEYIADGDYEINIKGLIVSENNQYPSADVASLIEICKRSENIRVTSNFLNLFSIDDIVIESYSFEQLEGYTNVQKFEINAISDKPTELVLSENL